MEFPNIDQLRFLFQKREQFCVSLFLPTHRSGPETRKDPIRLKNLIKDAESRLIALGRKPVKAREMLTPARELARRGGFWRQQTGRLGRLSRERLVLSASFADTPPELVSVAETFEVSPMPHSFCVSAGNPRKTIPSVSATV
jgi:hypothetical protein